MDISDHEVISRLATILAKQQGISAPIRADHRICGDLGVCGGDFQDFMAAAWEAYELPRDEAIHLNIPEAAITLSDVAGIIVRARLRLR